ncbi:MAG: hypothetical protein AAF563_04720 [Pseudomonadota bacterium]
MLPASVRDEFIGLLMETGNVSEAARTLGINRMTAYGWRDDPELARRWDVALDVARQGLRERVVETACALGVGGWVPARDPITDEVVLDDDFEPVMRFETRHVDPRVLMKLMDKTMRTEDGAPVTAVQVNNHVQGALPPAPRLVMPAADAVDAEFEEATDDDA